MSNPTGLVQKLWNYYNILREDGLSYGDYVEQLTFLLVGSLAPARSGLRPFARRPAAQVSKWQNRPGSVLLKPISGGTPLPLSQGTRLAEPPGARDPLTELHVKHSLTAWLRRYQRLAIHRVSCLTRR